MPAVGDVSTYQQQFDERHRTVGVMARGVDVFAGVKFKGFIFALNTPAPTNPDGSPKGAALGMTLNAAVGAVNRLKNPASDDDFGATTQGPADTVNFLYNPSSITVSYQANPNVLPFATLDPSQIGQPTGNNGPTISFDILFDRTYEVGDGSMLGVLTDILALERLCGISADSPVMALSPVVIGFSSPQQFIFKALLTSMEVQYTHFSQYMVPMRCGVSLTAQRISSNVQATADQASAYYNQNPDSKPTNFTFATSSSSASSQPDTSSGSNAAAAPAAASGPSAPFSWSNPSGSGFIGGK